MSIRRDCREKIALARCQNIYRGKLPWVTTSLHSWSKVYPSFDWPRDVRDKLVYILSRLQSVYTSYRIQFETWELRFWSVFRIPGDPEGASAEGSLSGICDWFSLLCSCSLDFGYFPEPSLLSASTVWLRLRLIFRIWENMLWLDIGVWVVSIVIHIKGICLCRRRLVSGWIM